MVIRGNAIVVDNELVDSLVIYKPLFDIRDATSKNIKIKASLLFDGTGIMVTEPKVPSYFYKEVEKIHLLEGLHGCETMRSAHHVAAKDIRNQTHRQQKRVLLRFPEGVTCKVGHFNGATSSNDNKLKNNLRMMEMPVNKQGNQIATVQFIYWRVVIEGTHRCLNSDGEESDDCLEDAVKRMGNIAKK